MLSDTHHTRREWFLHSDDFRGDYYQIECDIKITKRNEPVPERVVTKLQKIEVLVGYGNTLIDAFRYVHITE